MVITAIEALKNSQSDPKIIERLKELAKTPMSKEEKFEQMVSFVIGCSSSDNNLSADDVRKILKGMGY